jgi:ferredoxin-NADP reductase
MNDCKEKTITVRVIAIRQEAEGVKSFELSHVDQQALPPFTAGSHVDVFLLNGMVRQYSLVNPPHETHRYVIAVNLDSAGRGGACFMHQKVRAGDLLTISVPRNNFALDEEARSSVLIAGGIGITPLWCMIQRLELCGKSWKLYYCARSRARAAFLQKINLPKMHGSVVLNFDDEPAASLIDFSKVFQAEPEGTHFYCCGPAAMLDKFESEGSRHPAMVMHSERFSAKKSVSIASSEFLVELALSGRSYLIPADKSILDVLLDAGEPLLFSCKEGVCGSCETTVLDGEPDHRDSVLSDVEKSQNKSMMLCVSRCKSSILKLNL